MKILHIINSLAGGGAERLVSQIVPLMNKNYIQCDVLILSSINDIYSNYLIEHGVFVNFLPYKNMFDPRIPFYFYQFIKHYKYDIIHAHLFPTIYWTSLITYFNRKKVRFVMTEHNTYNKRRKIFWLVYFERIIYYRYAKIISISKGTQDNLIKWLKPHNEIDKYIVIENGILINEYKNATSFSRSEFEITENITLLCMVGRFTIQKNHKNMMKAMTLLPEKVHIVLIGDGEYKECIQELVKELKITHRVYFLGFRTDVARIIKTSDIFVIPSLWEGFGLVSIEAMACGIPIAASDVSGLREIIGNCGVFFNPNNPEDIANKLNILINNIEFRLNCIEKGFINVEKYNINLMVKRYIELYKNIY